MHADETDTNDEEMSTLSVRLPRELLGALRDVAAARHRDVNVLVRESIRSYIRPF